MTWWAIVHGAFPFVRAGWAEEEPTAKQLAFLEALGVTERPESKLQAHEWIQAELVEVTPYEPPED